MKKSIGDMEIWISVKKNTKRLFNIEVYNWLNKSFGKKTTETNLSCTQVQIVEKLKSMIPNEYLTEATK